MINVVVAAETKTSPCKWQRWGFTLTLGLVFKHSKRYTMDRSQIDVEQMKQCQVLVLAHFENTIDFVVIVHLRVNRKRCCNGFCKIT